MSFNIIFIFKFSSLLNDGMDYIFENIQIPSFSDETVTVHQDENIHGWDNIVLHRINEVRANKIIAGALEDMFFSFENWPAYMVNLFVQINSYAMRKKICLFFWGNGSPIDTMLNLSLHYAPRINLRTHEEITQYAQSKRKCYGLFKSYSENRFNANYNENYYYYDIIQKKMLYIDGKPRHFGRRQEHRDTFQFK